MDYIRNWFSRAFRGLQVYDWTIRARGRWADTCTPESCPLPTGSASVDKQCKNGWTDRHAV